MPCYETTIMEYETLPLALLKKTIARHPARIAGIEARWGLTVDRETGEITFGSYQREGVNELKREISATAIETVSERAGTFSKFRLKKADDRRYQLIRR